MIAILLIPNALCFAFGRVVGDSRQGTTLIWTMGIIFTLAIAIVVYAEMQGNPQLMLSGANSNINLEGKKVALGF